MKLEQHFYTSGEPEFMTVAMTEGISREERIRLETNSIYFLPVSLHYQDNVAAPVKYIWYPLGEDRFVVGQAVYTGKDSLGRTGNYLFHHYIMRQDDLLSACQSNPVSLIKSLRRQRVFRHDAPADEIQPFELDEATLVVSETRPRHLPQELLQRMLHACLEYQALHQPALLLGTEDECLDFLEQIYTVLPYEVRLALQVDTYAYGVSLGFPVIGSLDEEVFHQGLTSSLTVRLGNLEMTVYDEFPAPSRYLTMLLEKVTAGEFIVLDEVFSLEYALTQKHLPAFTQGFQQASEEIRQIIWDFHSSPLLHHITAEQDTELLRMVRPLLTVEQIDTLYLAPELLDHLIEDDEPAVLSLVAQWLCTPGTKELFYPSLFSSLALWRVWLDMLQAHPDTATFLLNPLRAFKAHYSVAFEQTLLEHLLMLLPALRENRKLAKDVYDILEELPPPAANIPEGDAGYADVLRDFITYELRQDAELCDDLLGRDLTVLSAQQRMIVLESVLDSILVVRSLQIWNAAKVAQQLRTLFANAERDPTFGRDLLVALTKIQLSKEAHKILEQILAEFRAVLLQGNDDQQTQDLITQVLQPPPSMFSKFTRLLGFK